MPEMGKRAEARSIGRGRPHHLDARLSQSRRLAHVQQVGRPGRLRVGYGAFPEWLLPQLWKIKQPYNVNVAATLAAIASLEDIATLQDNLGKLIAERDRLSEALSELDFLQPYPSQSNFILCRVLDRDARQLKLALEQQGILVRYFDKPGLRDCIRISVGKPEHTEALIEALKRVTSNE